jgi:hypothetical protein
VAGVVAGIVFSILQLTVADSEPDETELPPDDRLELIDLEYANRPINVPVRGQYDAGEDSMRPVTPGETSPQRPLVLTFRNPSGSAAVLTGIKLVIHETHHVRACGKGNGGGGVDPTLNYDFGFPADLKDPWEKVNGQNFSIPAHGVDALSVTVGPDISIKNDVTLWRFSIYGVSSGGRESHWGDVVAMEEMTFEDQKAYVWGSLRADGLTKDLAGEVRNCSAHTADQVEAFRHGGSMPSVEHPSVAGLVAAHRAVAQPNSWPE